MDEQHSRINAPVTATYTNCASGVSSVLYRYQDRKPTPRGAGLTHLNQFAHTHCPYRALVTANRAGQNSAKEDGSRAEHCGLHSTVESTRRPLLVNAPFYKRKEVVDDFVVIGRMKMAAVPSGL